MLPLQKNIFKKASTRICMFILCFLSNMFILLFVIIFVFGKRCKDPVMCYIPDISFVKLFKCQVPLKSYSEMKVFSKKGLLILKNEPTRCSVENNHRDSTDGIKNLKKSSHLVCFYERKKLSLV